MRLDTFDYYSKTYTNKFTNYDWTKPLSEQTPDEGYPKIESEEGCKTLTDSCKAPDCVFGTENEYIASYFNSAIDGMSADDETTWYQA